MLKVFQCAAVVVFGLAIGTMPATAQTADSRSGRLLDFEVPAPSLEGNLLGTPDRQNAAVYLPPGYDEQPDRRFPVVYLLHGIFDDRGVWSENYDVPAILDELINGGDVQPVIAVMPDGGNRYGGGYYRNSVVSGNWADYVTKDLVGFIDANFRTRPAPDGRAVIGHSMGGYGALHLAMEHPGVFSVVWALSPCCLAPTEDLGFGNDAWRRAASVQDSNDIQTLVDSRDFYPIAILGLIAAFNPDPKNDPVYGHFPFELVGGEVVLNEQAFDTYADVFPIRQVRSARAHLRDLRGLGMDVGLGDQFLHIPAGTLAFSQRLGAERVPHLLDVYAGDHRQHVSDRLDETVLPWVIERLSFEN